MNASLYNENDPFAARWLCNLIEAECIALGEVDDRSIRDLKGADLDGRPQVHLFAGIGGWSYALRLAGWPDDRPVWTGSCPCQPFSAAGKRKGGRDDRNLWPDMCRLIRECRPNVVFGEQVESAVAHGWLDGVFGDLEAEGYACGAVVLGAHSVGAPHIRHRLFWVAESNGSERLDAVGPRGGATAAERRPSTQPGRRCDVGRMGNADSRRCGERTQRNGEPLEDSADRNSQGPNARRSSGRLEHPPRDGRIEGRPESIGRSIAARCESGGLAYTERSASGGHARELPASETGGGGARNLNGGSPYRPWDGCVLIPCADGKARRVEPSIQPLAHGVPNRVVTLRGAGNAIIPQVAAAFVSAFMAVELEEAQV